MRSQTGSGYMNPYLAGILLGVVLYASYMLTGHGLGASGGIARIIGGGLSVVWPRHVDTSIGWASIAGGARSVFGHWLVWALLGTVLGGLLSGLLAGRVRIETFKGPRIGVRERLLFAFIGGALVGWASQMARGCTSGQALSGGAVMAAGSWAFMFSVFGGGYLLAWFVRKLWI